MVDKDLARLFENAYPNTLDTTIRWHTDGTDPGAPDPAPKGSKDEGKWQGYQTFVVTGDINAEWLRDSTNQLAGYQHLAKEDKKLFNLILGAINTQAEYVIQSPYCNAFQPPPASNLAPSSNGQGDTVHPVYEPSFVFECKYELDSLAAFVKLSNDFYENTGSMDFINIRWKKALYTVLQVLDEQSKPTFDPDAGYFDPNRYSFQRQTNSGTETLNLGGIGNPLNNGTGLVRSAFRPSDDATILGFLIPANAMMVVELRRLAKMLNKVADYKEDAADLVKRADVIEKGIWTYGTVDHAKWGKVFAYEVDGYGSTIMMDDANLPSLLALPYMGFTTLNNTIYQNTRKMLLSKAGNPYYLSGYSFKGIGGPHIGLQHGWPMAVMVQAMTSTNKTEIAECFEMVKKVSAELGLIHESQHVGIKRDYTRSWFAWANAVFAAAVIDIGKRMPELIYGAQ